MCGHFFRVRMIPQALIPCLKAALGVITTQDQGAGEDMIKA